MATRSLPSITLALRRVSQATVLACVVAVNANAANTQAGTNERRVAAGASGDLNADGRPDRALLVTLPPAQDGSARRAVVVQLRSGETWHDFARAEQLVPATPARAQAGGLQCEEDPFGSLRIEHGVLIVRLEFWSSCGSWSETDETYRFRLDPKLRRLVLIGLDRTTRSRASGEQIAFSANRLTGEWVSRASDPTDQVANERARRGRLKRADAIYFFEDVVGGCYDKAGALRPWCD